MNVNVDNLYDNVLAPVLVSERREDYFTSSLEFEVLDFEELGFGERGVRFLFSGVIGGVIVVSSVICPIPGSEDGVIWISGASLISWSLLIGPYFPSR